jgi:hypothetical protein
MQEQGLAKNLLEMEHNSPEYLHALIEALRRVLETLIRLKQVIKLVAGLRLPVSHRNQRRNKKT